MPVKRIASLFTNKGVPALGLTPTINVWEITDSTQTLIVNSATMVEVGDGFYKYIFTTYDPNVDYLFRTDGGSILNTSDRYQQGANEHFGPDVAHYVMEEQTGSHVTPGSYGESFNNSVADVTQLRLDTVQMLSLIQILIKYQTNRTRIDKDDRTLTIYDDDGTTVIRVFDLIDSTGSPSVTEVWERVPQ